MIKMTTCRRCKRTIRNVTSVVHGYGPVCWKKALKEASIPKDIKEHVEEHPCQAEEVCIMQ